MHKTCRGTTWQHPSGQDCSLAIAFHRLRKEKRELNACRHERDTIVYYRLWTPSHRSTASSVLASWCITSCMIRTPRFERRWSLSDHAKRTGYHIRSFSKQQYLFRGACELICISCKNLSILLYGDDCLDIGCNTFREAVQKTKCSYYRFISTITSSTSKPMFRTTRMKNLKWLALISFSHAH